VSFADIVTSMQQIQAQLALLQGAAAPASVGSAANASAFAGALDDATGATDAAAATGSGALTTGSATGKDVVRDAMQYVGTPYVLGGESKSGMDCSGLVQRTFADLGVKVPRLVHEQQTIGQAVPSLKDAKPGDLIVLNGGDHIAIYAGNNTVIHAPYEGRTVSVQKAWFTDKDIVTIRRVVPSEATGTAGTGGTAGTSAAAVQAASLASALGGFSPDDAASGSSDTSLSSLLSSIGASGTASSGTTQQLLAARAALLEGAA